MVYLFVCLVMSPVSSNPQKSNAGMKQYGKQDQAHGQVLTDQTLRQGQPDQSREQDQSDPTRRHGSLDQARGQGRSDPTHRHVLLDQARGQGQSGPTGRHGPPDQARGQGQSGPTGKHGPPNQARGQDRLDHQGAGERRRQEEPNRQNLSPSNKAFSAFQKMLTHVEEAMLPPSAFELPIGEAFAIIVSDVVNQNTFFGNVCIDQEVGILFKFTFECF